MPPSIRAVAAWSVAAFVCVTAGCQSAPPSPVPPPTVNPPAAARPASPVAAAPDPAAGLTPDKAAKLAESQAKSIDELLASRDSGDGVTVLRPTEPAATAPPAAVPPAAVPPAAAPPATPMPPPSAPPAKTAADDFRAVPPLSEYHPPADVPAGRVPPAASVPEAAVPPTPAPATPTPRPVSDGLGTRIQRNAAAQKSDLSSQLDAQLYQLLDDQPVPSSDGLAGLTGEDQRVLQTVTDGLAMFRNGARRDPNQLIGDKIRPLTDMADRLRGQADLRIVNLTLCRKATGFGKYDPIDPPSIASRPRQFPAIYYEVENVDPVPDKNNLYLTSLTQEMTLYSEAGKAVWMPPKRDWVETCRNRRHDFFLACELSLPVPMTPGRYTLKVTLTDTTHGRVTEKSIPLTVTP